MLKARFVGEYECGTNNSGGDRDQVVVCKREDVNDMSF